MEATTSRHIAVPRGTSTLHLERYSDHKPQEPTRDERSALKSYFHLFRQVPFPYSQPVSDNSSHLVASTHVANAPPSFKRYSKSSHLRQVDLRNPPRRVFKQRLQTSSRKSASLWLCSVHNMVNTRLGKPEFDCLTLDSTYDCGCADEGE